MTRSILSKKFQTFHLLSPARSVRCLVCSTCSVACSKGSEKTLAPKVVSDSMGPLKPMRQLFCRVASLTSVVSLFHGALQPLRYRSSITIGSSDAAVRQLNDGQGSSATASRWSQRIGPRTEQKRAGSMQSLCSLFVWLGLLKVTTSCACVWPQCPKLMYSTGSSHRYASEQNLIAWANRLLQEDLLSLDDAQVLDGCSLMCKCLRVEMSKALWP